MPMPRADMDWDHPRIRGEHVGCQVVLLAVVGSSPHTRGALAPDTIELALQRIIPAYAGSTTHARAGHCFVSDHPRIRGEHPRGLQSRH